MVTALLEDLARCPQVATVILTYNLPESEISFPESLAERVIVLHNSRPMGFAANHNAAFRHCTTPYFCILNPDIRLPENPFKELLGCFDDVRTALVAPAVLNPAGCVEDSARSYPTPWLLFLKALGITDGCLPYRLGDPLQRPDWLAGMFLLVRSDVFRAVGGFDAGFHLYYEDVDLGARLRKAGHELLLCPGVSVVHDARRTSHRNPRFLSWHLASMVRYLYKHWGRLPGKCRG
jgi:hypothetical protein